MAGLISPLQPGYSVVSLHSDIAAGLVKGTLFWGVGKFPAMAPANNKIYSSSNGTTWTERTTEASAAVSVTFPGMTMLQFYSPVVVNDLFLVLAKVSILYGAGIAYVIVAFNGTTWSVADVTALFGSRGVAYLANDFPLQVANSNFFLSTSTGIFKSTDGATWTESYALPAYELGGPTYHAHSVIYVSGTYYSLWNDGTTTTFISSSNLSSWTEVTSLTGYFTRLFYAGGKFYAQAFYGIYESANFSSWTSRYWQEGVAFPIEPFPFGDGFFARVDRGVGISYSLNYLQYAKTTLSDFWDIPTFKNDAISVDSLRVFLYNDYVYGSGGNGAFCFKYNPAWDDNSGVPDRAGTMATSERDDLVSAAGTSAVYLNTISGTLRLDTSSGPFAARNVFLYRYADGEKLAATVSNASDGTWSFSQVPPGDYFVVGVASSLDLAVPRDFDALGVITVA